MLSPGQVIIVAVAPAKCVQSQPWPERDARMEPEDTEIVGYSVWILRGANKVPIQWNQDSFWRSRLHLGLFKVVLTLLGFNRMLLMLEEQLYFFFSPDCTTSFKTIHFFHSTAAAILKDNGVEEHIELNTLAVHPGRQRMGIGASLMKWGLSKASGEGSRVVLEATEVGLGLYEKMGFRKMGAVFLEDKKVDGKLIESLVVPVMVWNPSKDRGERGGK